jgi:hypothetical protein
MDTKVSQGSCGWRAETRLQLNDKQALKVDTYKDSRGVVTTATVIEPTDGGGFHWKPMTDFHERMREGAGLRCTEKTVRSEHAAALTDIEPVKARAVAFYAAQKAESV